MVEANLLRDIARSVRADGHNGSDCNSFVNYLENKGDKWERMQSK